MADVAALLERLKPQVAELAAYVGCGRSTRLPGVVVQEAVGRLFFADYAASAQSYAAARTLQGWLAAGPVKSFILKRSGALPDALDRIMTLARGDTACAHATALAMGNIVKSIGLMRKLAGRGDNLASLGPQDAVARTLRGPDRVVREARDGARIGALTVRARSLVMLAVEAARRQRPDPGFGFFASAWNRCPAHSLVPALLAGSLAASQERSRRRHMNNATIFKPIEFNKLKVKNRIFPLEHFGPLRQRGRLRHPDAHQLGGKIRQGQRSAPSSRPTCRC